MEKISFTNADEGFTALMALKDDVATLDWSDITNSSPNLAGYRANLGAVDIVDFGRTIVRMAATAIAGTKAQDADAKAITLLVASKDRLDDKDIFDRAGTILAQDMLDLDLEDNHTFLDRTAKGLMLMAFTTQSYPSATTFEEWKTTLFTHGAALMAYANAINSWGYEDREDRANLRERAQTAMAFIGENWAGIWS